MIQAKKENYLDLVFNKLIVLAQTEFDSDVNYNKHKLFALNLRVQILKINLLFCLTNI